MIPTSHMLASHMPRYWVGSYACLIFFQLPTSSRIPDYHLHHTTLQCHCPPQLPPKSTALRPSHSRWLVPGRTDGNEDFH
ncbi:hypothetical protein B0T19DRAFT_116844 [Cercophora scortea]|uniref:Uncharacterized protein n=1 Tax=Cercophora scortea TaxID=314031 RepID=A0AAE0MJ87_9PEZI|nr:hypothetical protein B0T19DRAFT_116844 [Cercophora scortea]